MNNQTVVVGNSNLYNSENDEYDVFLQNLRNNFALALQDNPKIFYTNADNLFEIFLDNLPAEARQHYNCNTCKRFVNKYGNIAMINGNGSLTSPIWNEIENIPTLFKASIEAMKKKVEKAIVTNVFYSSKITLGVPVTEQWHHMSLQVPRYLLNSNNGDDLGEYMAEKLEDFKMLKTALEKYSLKSVSQALLILSAGAVNRSEKFVDNVQWFKELHDNINGIKDVRRINNLIWKAVSKAKTGFCHINSGMIGTLLDDITEGFDLEEVQNRFNAKVSGDKYQRPQVAPSAGNIKRAEEIFTELGLESALKRRYARLEELPTIWKPEVNVDTTQTKGGIFTSVKPKTEDGKNEPSTDYTPMKTITWEKFLQTVLPTAKKIEYQVKHMDNYSAIVTAADSESEPILKWDSKEQRNPFSSYAYYKGSQAYNWGLCLGKYVNVNAIINIPNLLYSDSYKHLGEGITFILDGARDLNHDNCGSALFPEILIDKLREVSSVIEAYTKNQSIEGFEDSSACGVSLSRGTASWGRVFRVTSDIGVIKYSIDRWE
jgi:hypothetical protein